MNRGDAIANCEAYFDGYSWTPPPQRSKSPTTLVVVDHSI